jgi:hypothetical protein
MEHPIKQEGPEGCSAGGHRRHGLRWVGYFGLWVVGGLAVGLGLFDQIQTWYLAWQERVFLPRLPTYSLTLEADGQRLAFSDPAGGRLGRVTPSSTLTVLLRPAATVLGPVAERSFLCREGRCWPWAVWLELLVGGSFLMRAQVATLPDLAPETEAGASGEGERGGDTVPQGGRAAVWELLFAVGRPAALPATVTSTMREGAVGWWSGWQLLRATVEVERDAGGDDF